MINVTFICLGNICRSPMAEAVFQDLVDKAGLSDQFMVDSAGTSRFHIGEAAHPGTRQVLATHGINYVGRARQISARDLSLINYIIAMDRSNLRDLEQIARDRDVESRMSLLLSYREESSPRDVPDPYYSGNFEYVYQLVKDGCEGLLAHIQKQEGL